MPKAKRPQSLQVVQTDEEVNTESNLIALSIKLTPKMLAELRERAENIGIGYQALIKVFIAEGLNRADK